MKTRRWVLWFAGGGVLLVLFGSVVFSGVQYQYDLDELSHVQYTYLIAHGYTPYKDFFLRFTPVFYWFQWPLFHWHGFRFETILLLRWVMIFLYLVRLGLMWIIFRAVWQWKIATLSIFLLLLDPFTTFVGMQIRPDNLMMTVYIAGIAGILFGLKHSSYGLLFFGAMALSGSLILLLKILPALAIVGVGILGWLVIHKRRRQMMVFVIGASVPISLIVLYAAFSGLAADMFQEIILDSSAINRAILYPTQAWYFYRPNNNLLFGFWGRPLTWWYVWALPLVAAAGVVLTIRRWRSHNHFSDFFAVVLAGSLLTQYLWVFVFRGTFIQYFLSFSWLLAGFAAAALIQSVRLTGGRPLYGRIWTGTIGAALLAVAVVSVRANLFRATVGNTSLIESYAGMWQDIPERETIFPNILFRPTAYPLVYGTFIGDMPKSLIRRLGPVHEWLERKKTNYLLVDSFTMMFLHPATQDYIRSQFTEQEKNFWIRKK